jgi:two-component system NtrC family sensor kinase
MDEYYRVPTLALLSILVAVFAALYLRSRTRRTFFWLIGWAMAIARLALQGSAYGRHGVGLAISNTAMAVAALMLLASVSPIHIRIRLRAVYLAAFAGPLILYSVLASLHPSPGTLLRIVDLAAVLAFAAVALHWSLRKSQPLRWFALAFVTCFDVACVWLAFAGQYDLVLRLAHSGISLMTAVLVLTTYRRWSAGVIFTATGLLVWSSPMVVDFLLQPGDPYWLAYLRAINLMKVVTAVGMIVLVLEDELIRNEEAQKRDRRVRTEMEQYARLDISAAPHRNTGFRYERICETITAASRFGQAAILLRSADQNYRIIECAGMDGALAGALDSLGQRTAPEKLDEFRRGPHCVPVSGRAILMDLRPLMAPGDELEPLKFDRVYAIPMETGSAGFEGMVLLAGLKSPAPLEAEDFLPLELLTRRLAAQHENYLLLRRIAQSEKLAGLGQLAGGVAHELNNPLTVVMGYAELIKESGAEDSIRRSAAVIHRESQRMRQTIEGLAHFSKFLPEAQTLVSLDEMLTGIWRQRKPEFDRAGIDLDLSIAPDLPKIRANGDQMRQVIIQVLSNAATALQNTPGGERRLRMHAALERNRVQILISDTGPGFQYPDRVFDPFFTTKQPGQGSGLGLSLCYAILREHGGEISAFNLHPHGAAVAIELPAAVAADEPAVPGEVLTN